MTNLAVSQRLGHPQILVEKFNSTSLRRYSCGPTAKRKALSNGCGRLKWSVIFAFASLYVPLPSRASTNEWSKYSDFNFINSKPFFFLKSDFAEVSLVKTVKGESK